MRKVFLSFLGTGNYFEVEYSLEKRKLPKTKFVQVAEVNYYGRDFFQEIIVVVTKSSKEKHLDELEKELLTFQEDLNLNIIEISEDLDPASQWEGFERIIDVFQMFDELYVDMTHGFRVVPVMFSTVINFLQQTKKINLSSVYYGAYDKENKPIVDVKDFYMLNKWTDGVARLIDNADTSKLSEAAQVTNSFQFNELNDPKIINAFNEMTGSILNVDINNISKNVSNALKLIEQKKEKSSTTGKQLLDLVIDKFVDLTQKETLSGKYDYNYYFMQLKIIKLLLEHNLYMQAFTAMREFVGSIGMLSRENISYSNNKGRRRRQYAEIFLSMISVKKESWVFSKDAMVSIEEYLDRFYEKSEEIGLIDLLKEFISELRKIRNGFDHAWTKENISKYNIKEKSTEFYNKLENVLEIMKNNNLFGDGA